MSADAKNLHLDMKALWKEKAIEDCIRVKAQQILAKKKGIVEDIDYDSFLKKLEKENNRRKNELKNNKVVYGPHQYGENEYFTKVLDDMIFELVKTTKSEIKISDKELKDYYDKNMSQYYKDKGDIHFQALKICNKENGANNDLKSVAEKIKENLNAGEKIEQVPSKYSNDNLIKIEYEDTLVTSKYYFEIARKMGGLLEKIEKLPADGMNNLIESENVVYIVKCLSKTPSGFMDIDEVKDRIVMEISQNNYETEISRIVKESKVVINQKVYEGIGIE